MPQVTFKIEKQAPTINVADGNSENLELFHGIGNTLGFNITGGSDFSMPITIFHVKEGSRAENAGLKLGDSIVNINNIDTSNMTLQEANNVLEQAAQQDVKLGVIKFDEVDEANPEKKPQVHSVVLEGKRKAQRNKLPYEDELRPPSAAYIEKPERKSWHPIMWPTPEFAQPVNFQKELPHKRIIRNLRRLLTDIADKPAEREKHLEQLLLSLPRGSADPLAVIRPKPESSNEEEEFPEGSINVELTVKSIQRQLLQIAEKIPDDIMLTLLKSFAKILSREPEPVPKTPFIRAFAKIRDENNDKQFSAIVEEDEDQLKDYDSGNEAVANDCSFNYKVTTNTEEVIYSAGSSDQNSEQQLAADEGSEVSADKPSDEMMDVEEQEEATNDHVIIEDEYEIIASDAQSSSEIEETVENIDEGIEVEMPNSQPTEHREVEVVNEEVEVNEESNDILIETTEETLPSAAINNEELEVEVEETSSDELREEQVPVERGKVTLDDIQREIQEMQAFLLHKGIAPDKKSKEGKSEDLKEDSKKIEDAYKLDFCIKLKNRNDASQDNRKSNKQANKYLQTYKEEIIDEGPIFDPTVPNTPEDFMKVKSVSERIHRKQQKIQPLDISWQNLCDQKKHYKHSPFEKSVKNVIEQQKNIKFK